MHVLIGTDGSEDANEAASGALSLLAPCDKVTVLLIADIPGAATAGMESGFSGGMARPEEIDAAWEALNAESAASLESTVAALSTTASIDRLIDHGDPGPVICRVAEELDADVIVVGSRGRGAIRRALLGSVSTYVAANAPCSVLIGRR